MREVIARLIVVFVLTFGVALAAFWVVKQLGFEFEGSWHDGRIGAVVVAGVVALGNVMWTSTRRMPTSR